jgi:hypothetical protein
VTPAAIIWITFVFLFAAVEVIVVAVQMHAKRQAEAAKHAETSGSGNFATGNFATSNVITLTGSSSALMAAAGNVFHLSSGGTIYAPIGTTPPIGETMEYMLPERDDDEPIGAFKAARLIWKPGGLQLWPINTGTPHQRLARFNHGHRRSPSDCDHAIELCSCGFYALKSRADAYGVGDNSVLLEVELGGRVVVYEHGYKAEWQRILSVVMPGKCYACGAPSTVLAYREYGDFLSPRCEEHGPCFGADVLLAPTVIDIPITFDMDAAEPFGYSNARNLGS